MVLNIPYFGTWSELIWHNVNSEDFSTSKGNAPESSVFQIGERQYSLRDWATSQGEDLSDLSLPVSCRKGPDHVGMWRPNHVPHSVRSGQSPLLVSEFSVLSTGMFVKHYWVHGKISCSKWEDNGLLAAGRVPTNPFFTGRCQKQWSNVLSFWRVTKAKWTISVRMR